MKKAILTGLTAMMVVSSVPAFAWSTGHCNTAVGETRSQKGQLLKECIGKYSKEKYTMIANDYFVMNGGVKEPHKMPKRVVEVIQIADEALKDNSIKWESKLAQDAIDVSKIVAAALGSATFVYAAGVTHGVAGIAVAAQALGL